MKEKTDKISILDFVNKYNSVTSEQIRKTMLESVIKSDNTYIPYQEKIMAAKQIISKANYVYEKDAKLYQFNGPLQYLNYVKALLDLYSNFKTSVAFDEEFDVLNQNDLLAIIIRQMPNDKVEFDTVFNMVRDDVERNEYYCLLNNKII